MLIKWCETNVFLFLFLMFKITKYFFTIYHIATCMCKFFGCNVVGTYMAIPFPSQTYGNTLLEILPGHSFQKCCQSLVIVLLIYEHHMNRNHMAMHRTLRNWLNNNPGSTSPENIKFTHSWKAQTSLPNEYIFNFLFKTVLLGANYKVKVASCGSEPDNTEAMWLVAVSATTVWLHLYVPPNIPVI